MILPADLSLNQLLSAVAVLLYVASALLGPQLGVANSRRMLSVAWGHPCLGLGQWADGHR